jgi:predicted nucleic acid-binding protein
MSCVLDASASVAWLHPWERTPAIEQFFGDLATTGASVPSLWRLEVANTSQMNVRRLRYNADVRDTYLDLLSELPISVDQFTDRAAWSMTLRLADRHKLTVYDAAYLELASRRDLPLATLDRGLRSAASRENVPLLGL